MSNVIYRGSTTTLNFRELPFVTSEITAGYITINQICKVAIDKALNTWELSDEEVSVKLTQEETLSLVANVPTTVQMRLKTDDDAFACAKIPLEVKDVNKDGKI